MNAGDNYNKALVSFVERIENLQEEKKSLADDIRDIFAEAKLAKFSTKAIKEVIKLRAQDQAERIEHRQQVDNYCDIMGVKWE